MNQKNYLNEKIMREMDAGCVETRRRFLHGRKNKNN